MFWFGAQKCWFLLCAFGKFDWSERFHSSFCGSFRTTLSQKTLPFSFSYSFWVRCLSIPRENCTSKCKMLKFPFVPETDCWEGKIRAWQMRRRKRAETLWLHTCRGLAATASNPLGKLGKLQKSISLTEGTRICCRCSESTTERLKQRRLWMSQ